MAEIFDNDLYEYLNEEDNDDTFDGDYELADIRYEQSRDEAAEKYFDTLDD